MKPANDNIEQPGYWTEEILPKTSLLDLRLKEVWRYKDLLVMFVKRDFVATYKQTILGPIWNFVQPILTTIMFLIVFSKIAGIDTEGINTISFYLSSITIWNYFANCLTGTSNTFVANAGIFGKVYFPRLILPLSICLSNVIKFGVQFLLLLAIMVIVAVREHHFYFGWTWLLVPFLVLIMAGLGLGCGIIISSLTTKYRDFAVLITFGIQLLMYATPVAYPLSYLMQKSSYAWLFNINPLSPILEAFRYAIFHSPRQHFNFGTLWYSVAFMVVTLIIGTLLFNKVERSFMDTV